mgnify:CR=1 FL=1
MQFNMKMFEPDRMFAVNRSVGYESVLEHNHSFVELVYVESGKGMQKIGFESMQLRKGDVFVIADDSKHFIRPSCEENDFKIINVIFEKEFIDVDYSAFLPCFPANFHDDSETVKYIRKCYDEYETRTENFEWRIRGYIYLILASVAEAISRTKQRSHRNHRGDYVQAATAFMHENFSKKLTLEDVAASVGLTSGYLQRLFRQERNTSVVEYLLRYRVEQACKMLMETEETVYEISREIGFSDVKNFHYYFKKMFGVTPNEFRKNHREEKL